MYEAHRREVERDMKDATEIFNRLMLPELNGVGRTFKNVEGTKLDTDNCIDGFMDGHSVGVRCQRDTEVLFTFTLKEEREVGGLTGVPKLRYLIANNLPFPEFQLQFYCNSDGTVLYGYGIAYTKDVIKMIDDGKAVLCHNNKSEIPSTLWSIRMKDVHDTYIHSVFEKKMTEREIEEQRMKRGRAKCNEKRKNRTR